MLHRRAPIITIVGKLIPGHRLRTVSVLVEDEGFAILVVVEVVVVVSRAVFVDPICCEGIIDAAQSFRLLGRVAAR